MMINMRNALYSGVVLAALTLGACTTTTMMTSSSAMSARLSGASEVPPVSSNVSGTVDASLDKQTNMLTWTVTYSGLSGPAKAAHFHGPAADGQNAGVAVPLTGSLGSPISGSASLTSAQASELMAGMWYLNLHTEANPNGEIRGQLTAKR